VRRLFGPEAVYNTIYTVLLHKQKNPLLRVFVFRYNTTSNPSNSGCPKYISWCFPPLLCAALNASDFFQFSKSFFDSHILCDAYRVYSSFEEPLIRLVKHNVYLLEGSPLVKKEIK
jgi:hypothetical protein